MKFLGYSKQDLKNILLSSFVGFGILGSFVSVAHLLITLGFFIRDNLGFHAMVVYFLFPIWSPITYLIGHSFLERYKK